MNQRRISDPPTVAIALSTFNGEKYLDQQLSSLQRQTYERWIVHVRDDGSTDETPSIIARFADRDSRFRVIRDSAGSLGAMRSFAKVVQVARAGHDYLMFCDQDDEWLPSKVELSMKVMLDADVADKPRLVHTDLEVVDARGEVLSPSFWRYAGIDPSKNQLSRLLFQNTVTGCTALINRPLMELLTDFPDDAVMHDWWVALVAAAFGVIVPIAEPTVRYRQHQQNVYGARRMPTLIFESSTWSRGLVPEFWRTRRHQILGRPIRQAMALLNLYRGGLPAALLPVLDGLSRFDSMPTLARKAFLLRHRCLRQRFAHNASMVLMA